MIKSVIPIKFIRKYSDLKNLKYRLEALEREKKNKWLLEKNSNIKDQKRLLELNEFSVYSQNGEDGKRKILVLPLDFLPFKRMRIDGGWLILKGVCSGARVWIAS